MVFPAFEMVTFIAWRSVSLIRRIAFEATEKIMEKISNLIGAQYLFFPFSRRRILKLVKEIKPDVISLHNTHPGYFQVSLLAEISALCPIVWTLHDMWSFTGNAAHTFGDESWRTLDSSPSLKKIYPSIGLDTGKTLLRKKARIYT